MARSFQFHALDECDTVRLGQALADSLEAGTIVALLGTLGAGKTRLVQAVAEALGVEPGTVTSPTFVLIREYAGRLAVYHFDAYRLRDEDEFAQLGPDEYFDAQGLSFVEWADRVEMAMPNDRLEITIDVLSPTDRLFTLTPKGAFPPAVLDKIEKLLLLR